MTSTECRERRDESYRQKANYIMFNPVLAGLVGSTEDWAYVFIADLQAFRGLMVGTTRRVVLPVSQARSARKISACGKRLGRRSAEIPTRARV